MKSWARFWALEIMGTHQLKFLMMQLSSDIIFQAGPNGQDYRDESWWFLRVPWV